MAINLLALFRIWRKQPMLSHSINICIHQIYVLTVHHWRHTAALMWINIGWGNGLVPPSNASLHNAALVILLIESQETHLAVISVGHPFFLLNSYWDLTGGKHYEKITVAIFKILLFQATFLIVFFIVVLSTCFLLVGLLLRYVALFQYRELVKV